MLIERRIGSADIAGKNFAIGNWHRLPECFEFHSEKIPQMVTVTQPFLRISQMVRKGFNSGMDTNEIRRRKIKSLINERFGGVDGKFADAIGRPRPNISAMLKGTRPVGQLIAHAIEDELNLGRGWLDREEDGDAIPVAPEPLPPDQKQLLDAYRNGGPVKQFALTQLAALPEQEMGMLLMVMQSAAAKYPIDPLEHLRSNERRAAEKLLHQNMTEPPDDERPLFTERRKTK